MATREKPWQRRSRAEEKNLTGRFITAMPPQGHRIRSHGWRNSSGWLQSTGSHWCGWSTADAAPGLERGSVGPAPKWPGHQSPLLHRIVEKVIKRNDGVARRIRRRAAAVESLPAAPAFRRWRNGLFRHGLRRLIEFWKYRLLQNGRHRRHPAVPPRPPRSPRPSRPSKGRYRCHEWHGLHEGQGWNSAERAVPEAVSAKT